MGAPSQTIGFHYLFSILFGIGRGPIDELRAIKVGDKIAWEGNLCEGEGIINKPELFGGEKKEGGIQGIFRLNQGEADQVLPGQVTALISNNLRDPYPFGRLPDLKALVAAETGGPMGELRGRVTLWYDGLVTSMNPYIKEWRFRVRRARKGWHQDNCWYPDKAFILMAEGRIYAMNPAHMIYESCTNPAWGRGLDPSVAIDENSFILAANTLCEEGFGLCMVWFRKEEIGEFIKTVLDHIGAVLYTDRETGLITLKLIRDDYVLADIPLFTPSSGLLDITEDDSAAGNTGVSEVIILGHDPINDEPIEMRAHSLAAFRAQGSISTVEQTYKGLPTKELCARIAQRDLRASAAGLRKFRIVLDRRGFKIHPGAVFRIEAPTRGIGQIVLRAGEIDDGKMIDGKIVIRAVQDVFGLPLTSFVKPVENTWTPPSDEALPADALLTEATYRQAYLLRGASEANELAPEDSFIATFAGRPSTRSLTYNLLSRAEGETDFLSTGDHYFTGTATLATTLVESDTSFAVENVVEFPDDVVGTALLVGEELMRIQTYDPETFTFTVKRGAEDTWPRAHPAGQRVWLADDDLATDARVYADGETVEAKVLPRTYSEKLDEADADLLTVTLEGRIARPLPPADVRVDGTLFYAITGLIAEPIITWVGRNRLTQADTLVGFTDAAVAPEVGTTYTIRVYALAEDEVPLATYDDVTSGWQYTSALQTADGLVGSSVWFEIVAVRDSIESWRPRRFRVALTTGWGYTWGFNWGGA